MESSLRIVAITNCPAGIAHTYMVAEALEQKARSLGQTGNLMMALFNHDTSRDQDPQLHTHVVVANVTQHNGEWKTLSSDKVGKTGFSENVLANRIAFGKIYQSELAWRPLPLLKRWR